VLGIVIHGGDGKSPEVKDFSLAVEKPARKNLDIPSCNFVDRKGHRPVMPESMLFPFRSLGGQQENN